MFKKIALALLIIFVVMQFFRPAKNTSTVAAAANIASKYNTPDNVQAVLKKACNDCHSNNTTYPWYAAVQPVGWWLDHHVDEGKQELNLDDFLNYGLRKQYHKLEEIIEQVKTGEMPLNSYTWTHKDAILTMEEKALLTSWSQSIRTQMEQQYPMDSLIRKKN
ncbi:MAG: heme-binding domain-containing protein [Flavihumibacter sp.]|nr:heme-binding domain-containing protein [Flavihumibacter sp.]